MSEWLSRAETVMRRVCALLAGGAALSLLPGLVRVVEPAGRTVGRPERVLSPVRLTAVAGGWVAIAAFLWRPLPITPGVRARAALLPLSVAAYTAGLALAIAGRLALGSAYRPSSTVGVRLAPGQQLVTEGPYSIVRHPMYVGLVLAAVGGLGLYRTWTTLVLVAQLPVLIVRARREDEALEAEFGASWRVYRARVPAWMPRGRHGLS